MTVKELIEQLNKCPGDAEVTHLEITYDNIYQSFDSVNYDEDKNLVELY